MRARRNAGQSTLEFMMSYGWAILIIIVALVVVWQWGLFNVGENITPGSFGFWGLEPKDFVMHRTGVLDLSVINNFGSNVTIVYYNASMAGFFSVCSAPCATVVTPDKTTKLTFNNLLPYSSGKRFEVTVFIRYNDTRTGSKEHVSSGTVWGAYED